MEDGYSGSRRTATPEYVEPSNGRTGKSTAVGYSQSDVKQPLRFYENAEYIMTDEGIFRRRRSKEPEKLCNFGAIVEAETVVDDGQQRSMAFQLAAWVDGRERRFELTADELLAMKWPVEQLGARAIIYPGQRQLEHIRVAIQSLSGQPEDRVKVKHLGWRSVDGELEFVTASGAIDQRGLKDELQVDLPQELLRYSLPSPNLDNDLARCFEASLRCTELLKGGKAIVPYAALWRILLGDSRLTVWIVAKTGTGKSELAATILQHLGRELDVSRSPGNWSSTGNALEALLFYAKDVPLLIDDFAPSRSPAETARQTKEAERIIRNQANRAGRQRLTRSSELRHSRPPRGGILSTAEDVPSNHSIQARTVIVEVPMDDMKWDLLTDCQANGANGDFAFVTACFLRWVARQYDEVMARLGGLSNAYRDEFQTEKGHKRSAHFSAEILAGFEVFLGWASAEGLLDQDRMNELVMTCRNLLLDGSRAQLESECSSDPVEIFLDLLLQSFLTGFAHLTTVEGSAPPNALVWGWKEDETKEEVRVRPSFRHIGYLDTQRGEAMLIPSAAYSAIHEFSTKSGTPLSVSEETLWKRLKEQGHLTRFENNRSKQRVSIGGKRIKSVCLRLASFSESADTSHDECRRTPKDDDDSIPF